MLRWLFGLFFLPHGFAGSSLAPLFNLFFLPHGFAGSSLAPLYNLIRRFAPHLAAVDRFGGNEFHATQPFAIRDELPPGNVVTTLVTGKVFDTLESNLFLQEGFDGVLIGEGLVGNPSASSLIKELHDLKLDDEGEINRGNVF